jgi:hypothetical protein
MKRVLLVGPGYEPFSHPGLGAGHRRILKSERKSWSWREKGERLGLQPTCVGSRQKRSSLPGLYRLYFAA